MEPVDIMDMSLCNYMKEFNHGPNSRMSITFNSSKGLKNEPGQNNCFLNSAVQVLWHLDAFRRSFRLLSGHSCMGNACIFCALRVMFTQFQYSDKTVLPADGLRLAMAETFANQQRFQLGFMDDAAECFENILMRIHNHIAPEQREDCCTAKHCIPHQKFSMSISEQVVCKCGARSEPFTFNEMVFYVSTGALVKETKATRTSDKGTFSQLLRNTVAKGDTRECPAACGAIAEKRRNLTNCPDVVSIGLVWESAKCEGQHIRDVVDYIGQTLNLAELFHSTLDDSHHRAEPLHLVGVVCYYGKHYSTFFFHSKVGEWIYFDDASVKQVSPSWSRVCEKLCKGRHQPLLLLYSKPNCRPVSVETAPRSISMAPGHEWKRVGCEETVNNSRERPKTPYEDSSRDYREQSRTPAPYEDSGRDYRERSRTPAPHEDSGRDYRERSRTPAPYEDSGRDYRERSRTRVPLEDSNRDYVVQSKTPNLHEDSGRNYRERSRTPGLHEDHATEYRERSRTRASREDYVGDRERSRTRAAREDYNKDYREHPKALINKVPPIAVDGPPRTGEIFHGLVHTNASDSYPSGIAQVPPPPARLERNCSQLSNLTRHSSDSGSSTNALHRNHGSADPVATQTSAIESFSSKPSPTSSSTYASTTESDMCNNQAAKKLPSDGDDPALVDKKKPKSKISLKKKKHRLQGQGADVVRYQSSASLAALGSTNEDGEGSHEVANNPGYATLPRKKKSLNGSTALPVSGEQHASWMRDVAAKGDEQVSLSVSAKIQMFNRMPDSAPLVTGSDQLEVKTKQPEVMKKPLLPFAAQADCTLDEAGYISRSNVEKILSQQRKASKFPVLSKIVRPTHDQFTLPDEYTSSGESNKSSFRFDVPDNTSLSSFKDSGYRSAGDRNSTSASSVSSLSAESPTTSQTFSYEPMYCEPPTSFGEANKGWNSSDHQQGCVHEQQATEEFPPPPDFDLYHNHSKQLSQASLLSEASTVRQRKTPSVESLDSPTRPLSETTLPTNDSKLRQMADQAEELMIRSQERERCKDLSTAFVFCHQAMSLLTTALAQQPSESLQSVMQHKYELCLDQSKALHKLVILEGRNISTVDGAETRQPKQVSHAEKKTKGGDVHIISQVKREATPTDYIPIHCVFNRVSSFTGSEHQAASKLTREHQESAQSPLLHAESNSVRPESQRALSQPASLSRPAVPPKQQGRGRPNPANPELSSLQRPFSPHRGTEGSEQPARSDLGPVGGRNLYCEVRVNPAAFPAKAQNEQLDVVPPPKEFRSSISAGSDNRTDAYGQFLNEQMNQLHAQSSNSANSMLGHFRPTVAQQRSCTNPANLQEQTNPNEPTRELYREVIAPSRENFSKEGIRSLLVQDMLKRTGQQPLANQQTGYASLSDLPLWTPPPKSMYDQGFSHYDRPNHHRPYGTVHTAQVLKNQFNTNVQVKRVPCSDTNLDRGCHQRSEVQGRTHTPAQNDYIHGNRCAQSGAHCSRLIPGYQGNREPFFGSTGAPYSTDL